MENLFLKYMDQRFEKNNVKGHEFNPGPVITISRVCGCSANLIAEMLTDKINKANIEKGIHDGWKWISKEILSMASQELKMHPEKVKQLLDSQERNFVQEIVASFTETYYAHGSKVKKVTEEVIRDFADKGNVIIVGRASGIITANVPRSLHVSLEAPLSWRTSVIGLKYNFTAEEAKKYVIHMDKQRETFKESFIPRDYEKPDYDLSINCKSLSMEQVCDIIYKAAELKNLI